MAGDAYGDKAQGVAEAAQSDERKAHNSIRS